MSSSSSSTVQRWRRRLAARLARPQPLFIDANGAAGLAAWCAAHRGEAVELIVSARLLHELVCEPGLPLTGEPALQAYARQLFGHYFGALAQRWPLATWDAADQRGATALHALDWAALTQAADQADVSLRRVRPAWAPLLQKLAVEEADWLRAPTAALAWVEGQVLTWIVLKDGRVVQLRQLRLPTATQAALGEALAELREVAGAAVLAIGYGLDAGATPVWPGVRVLSRLDGAAPELAWFAAPADANIALPQPDFLGPHVIRARLAWPLAIVGGAALLLAGGALWASHQALDEAQQRLAQMDRPAPTRAAVLPAARAATSAQDGGSRAAGEVQALLQQAWEPLLANVEQAALSPQRQAAPPLSWLGLDYSAGRNELRLEGLTQDKLAALRLVDRLAAAPGWQGVVLSRFQTGEQGLSGQRFELSARLTPALLKPELLALAAKERP
ncbi:hypothetical protein BH11PSE10_BH11PSE10_07420 [soil metagenome]